MFDIIDSLDFEYNLIINLDPVLVSKMVVGLHGILVAVERIDDDKLVVQPVLNFVHDYCIEFQMLERVHYY